MVQRVTQCNNLIAPWVRIVPQSTFFAPGIRAGDPSIMIYDHREGWVNPNVCVLPKGKPFVFFACTVDRAMITLWVCHPRFSGFEPLRPVEIRYFQITHKSQHILLLR